MNFRNSMLIIVIGLCLFSCATTMSEGPSKEKPTLLVGSASFEATGYKVYGNSSINGKHSSGMELVIVNMTTGEEIKLKANNNGYFFHPLESGCEYYVKELYYIDKGNDGSYISLTTTLSSVVPIRQDGGDAVINLGSIEWFCDNSKKWADIDWSKGYGDVESYFKNKYPESPWNRYEWIDFTWDGQS